MLAMTLPDVHKMRILDFTGKIPALRFIAHKFVVAPPPPLPSPALRPSPVTSCDNKKRGRPGNKATTICKGGYG